MTSLDTTLVHAGEPRIGGAISIPVFASANYEYAGEDHYDALQYIRLNNTPNHRALHQKLAAVEGAEAAVVTGSGMAAISTALLTVLGSGDHLLHQSCLYGGTWSLVTEDLPAFGMAATAVDARDPGSWEARLRPETRAFYVESMTNPLLEVADLEAVVAFCRRHDLVSLIDNTFATPVNFRPLELGFDLVLHSATKYLNGHSDLVAGVVLGHEDLVRGVVHRLNHLGGTLDPHACVLLHRGMKTLGLRVRRQNENAQALAEFLHQHPAVASVNYAGLPSHPDHERARRLFTGYGGVLSLDLHGGVPAALSLIGRLRLGIEAASLGGVETLVTRPVTTSHAGVAPERRREQGITDSLIRVAVGIEDPADLLEDFRQALG